MRSGNIYSRTFLKKKKKILTQLNGSLKFKSRKKPTLAAHPIHYSRVSNTIKHLFNNIIFLFHLIMKE